MEIIMTDHGLPETECTQAWRAQVRYHQDRAQQEQGLARRSQSEAARKAHSLLREHHLLLAASAEQVAAMPDAAPPQSSALQHTGWLMRESYRDAN